MDFTRLQAKRRKSDSSLFCEKTDTACGIRAFCGARCGRAGRDIESIVGDHHQEDSYYRTGLAINAKIGIDGR